MNGRSIVFVLGADRTASAVFARVLSQLGCRVPRPPLTPSDDIESDVGSQWVADWHAARMRTANIDLLDARPQAWTAALDGTDDNSTATLRAWLQDQVAGTDHVLVRDPRLAWCLPTWRQAAVELGAHPRAVVMLRHPSIAVAGDDAPAIDAPPVANLVAGWINAMLYTERATRRIPRVFVDHDALLEDWTRETHRVAVSLGLDPVLAAPTSDIRVADTLLRRASTATPGWDDLALPGELRERAEHVWHLLSALTTDPDHAGTLDALTAAHLDYTAMYAAAEAMTWSSVTADRRQQLAARRRPLRARLRRLARRAASRAHSAASIVRRQPSAAQLHAYQESSSSLASAPSCSL